MESTGVEKPPRSLPGSAYQLKPNNDEQPTQDDNHPYRLTKQRWR